MHFGETKLGKIGETISEKVLETAVFRQKVGKNDDFLRSQFASDSVIRWFESSYPSQFMHDFVNKQHKIVHIFYFYTLSHRPILAENRRLGRNWGVKGEPKTPPIGYKA